MLKYLARRLVFGCVTLLFISMLIFAATALLPGDAATALLGQNRTAETEAAMRHRLGLDRDPATRYVLWLDGVLHGDFGISLASDQPVSRVVGPRLRYTLFLAAAAALAAIPLSLTLGILCASKPDGLLDRVVNLVSLCLAAVPDFLVGLLLITFLAVQAQMFPAMLQRFSLDSLGASLFAVTLPVLTLVMTLLAYTVRMTRAAMVDVLRTPYAEMALLKGVPKWRLVLRHGLPNALSPIINVVALNLGYLISGVVIVEVVFTYPGLGQLLVDSIAVRDMPTVQAVALLFCTAYVVLNLVADLLVMLCSPRLRG